MRLFIDLHNHSKYSRATSKDMDLEHQSKWGCIKGLNILGTSDFTHPKWFLELKNKLKVYDDGVYEFKGMKWVLSAEISNVYSTPDGIKKVHHVLLAPNFEVVEQINELLGKKGNLSADGRPIFGKYPSYELVSDLKNISDKIEVIPAHIYTPYFSLFGSKSGFDNIKDCYQSQLRHIYCLETGLSSDPEMNWRLSQLDGFTLVSNSDSHSPWPWRLGRECNVLNMDELTYDMLIMKLRNNDLEFTIEVDPNYGKYHYDGHRNCNVFMHPKQAMKIKSICPKCHRKLTIGVLHRVEELADRPEGFKPKNAVPFKKLLPLHELIRTAININSLNSKQVWSIYNSLIEKFGNEFNILLNVPKAELENINKRIAQLVLLNRQEKIKILPGYDGEYGKLVVKQEKVNNKGKLTNYF